MSDPVASPSLAEPSFWRLFLAKLQSSPFWQRWWKELVVILSLLLTLVVPFVLKPVESTAPSRYDRRLVIITPHHEKIRQEFGLAFTRYWKNKTGEILYIDWRVPGGTSEISLFMRSEFAAAFEQHWTRGLGQDWSHDALQGYANGRLPMGPDANGQLSAAQAARKAFLSSDVGIGIDLFFGGGAFDFQSQTSAGYLVNSDSKGQHGVKALVTKHPDWFTDAVIPQSVSGEPYYDKNHVWVGCCLSSMGICFNRDVLKRLGIDHEPLQWEDLADPRYLGQIALSDPNKSGTVSKAFEQLIQQQMQIALDALGQNPGELKNDEEILNAALSQGWVNGLRLIQRITANARYFTDSATKIPMEVAQGDAAAGMCIDFYGRSFEEQVRKPDGRTRVGFVSPIGGTSVGVDPVALVRGAPEPAVASEFMEFVLSEAGQKLWNFEPGTAGGPAQDALRRLPVRRDFYNEANRPFMADANARPYDDAKAFTYHPEWTGSLFNVIRFLVKVMSIEVHDEQKSAWQALAQADFPKRASEVFGDLTLVNFQNAQALAAELKRGDKESEVRKARELSRLFRDQYDKAKELAKDGQ
jgi:iron(III) transport system substrate-binding protein